MTVSAEKAEFTSEYKDKTYYFCASGCKKRFDEDPEKYASGEKVDWVTGE